MSISGRSAEMEEIWGLFAQEGKENLFAVEESLLKLEQDAADLEQVKILFRALHSFKGGVRMMGLSVSESLAHLAEDLIALVRDQGVALDREMIDLLLTALDRMRAILDQILSTGGDVEQSAVQDLTDQFQSLIARRKPPAEMPAAGDVAAAVAVVEAAVPPPAPEPDPSVAPIPLDAAVETIAETTTELPAAGEAIAEIVGELPASADSIAETAAQLPDAGVVMDSVTGANGAEQPPVLEVLDVQAPPAPESDALGKEPESEVAKFLQFMQDALGRLHSALDGYATGNDAAITDLQALAQQVKSAAELMGYQRLQAVLDELVAETLADRSAMGREARIVRFQKIEMALFEELTQIQDTMISPVAKHAAGWTDITWLFRHWNAERVFSDLARLGEIADELERSAREFTMGASTTGQFEKLAEEATIHLRAVYHSCIFYHLGPAVHWTLALQDVYSRIMQGEFGIPEALTVLTRAYVTNIGGLVEAVREGDTPDLGVMANLIDQTENILYLQTDGPVFQVTRGILDVLNLPADYKDVMTPETLTQFSQALQAGEHFYTILADLELNEVIGAAFLQWSRSPGIQLITSITVYRYDRTLFNFLLSTTRTREDLLESLKKIDPEWRYLTLQACTLRQEVDLEAQRGKATPTHVEAATADAGAHTNVGVSNEVLEDMNETVGVLVEDHATLRRVTNRLIATDWVEEVMRIAAQTQGNAVRMQDELREMMSGWTESLYALHQMEVRMGPSLTRLEEVARSLRLAPASDVLQPLRRMVQELTARQGKLVELDLQGNDLKLDRGAIQLLTEPLRRIVWFVVTHSIENVEQRKLAGKTASGHITVKVSTHENHAQVVVLDDGRGIDRERVRARARTLGWTDGAGTAAGELDWVLRPKFGPVDSDCGAEGVDLSAINGELRAHQGRLSVTSEASKGTQFELRLPLEIAVVDGMVVRVGQVRYVIPVNAIRRIVNVLPEDVVHSSADGNQSFLRFEEELVVLSKLAGQNGNSHSTGLMAVVEAEQGSVALAIDELLGRQQVLVRPLPGQLADIRNASGCALLGEGEVGILLDRSMTGYQAVGEPNNHNGHEQGEPVTAGGDGQPVVPGKRRRRAHKN